jgi:hypothetical protein
MEYWNDGIVGRIFALFFVILHSAIRNRRGSDLMLWIMDGPERGTIQSSKFKVQS